MSHTKNSHTHLSHTPHTRTHIPIHIFKATLVLSSVTVVTASWPALQRDGGSLIQKLNPECSQMLQNIFIKHTFILETCNRKHSRHWDATIHFSLNCAFFHSNVLDFACGSIKIISLEVETFRNVNREQSILKLASLKLFVPSTRHSFFQTPNTLSCSCECVSVCVCVC